LDWASVVCEARQLKDELIARLAEPVAFADRKGRLGVRSALSELPCTVLGVGYGTKQTSAARVDGEMALRVYVRTKLPRARLTRSELVPSCINGTVTDVIGLGDIAALARPTLCGVSCGHAAITFGTLGCLVRRGGADGAKGHYILSANHVLANVNDAEIGDPILEPAPADGGTTPIARLTDFEPIDFHGINRIDAAIAEVTVPGDVLPEIAVIGRVTPPPSDLAVLQGVRKHGRTTLHTVGAVVDLSADIRVRYEEGVAVFEDQLGIDGAGGPFGLEGDSGSLVVDAGNSRPVALLFAGGTGTVFANPITTVLARFGVEIL
jgi:hypothetical protein